MPISLQCACGKRYTVADEAVGKRMRCKQCGSVITIRKKTKRRRTATADDEFGFGDLDLDDYEDGNVGFAPTKRTHTKRRGESQRSPTDLIVRIGGGVIFLGTLVNCAIQLSGKQAPDGELIGKWTLGIFPILIFGTLGLYITCIGENKDSTERRINRIRGVWTCLIGAGMILLGGILTFVVTMIGQKVGGVVVVFTGLIIGGVFFIAYGLLGITLGRDPRELAGRR